MENDNTVNVTAKGTTEHENKDIEQQDCVGLNVEDVAEEGLKDISKTHAQVYTKGLQHIVWPDDVEIYQPVASEQILFSEMPNCLYVEAYLRMCNLPYTLVQKTNAEYIGPSGEVPVLRCGNFIVSGAEDVLKFVQAKGISLTSSFKESEKCEISCYVSLVQMILANAELFVTWLDPETYSGVTQSKICSIYPWPLGRYMMMKKKRKIQNKLNAMGWGHHQTFEDVCEEVKLCFKALSDKLEENFFFGNQPTHIDALVFAHVYTIMTNPVPKSKFSGIILGYPKLVDHCYRVLDSYFKELSTSKQFLELVNSITP